MTSGDKVIAAFARGFFNLGTSQSATVHAVVNTATSAFAKFLGDCIDKNFPTQSMPERALKGPLVTLLRNSEKDIATYLSGTILPAYDGILAGLDARAKAGGA